MENQIRILHVLGGLGLGGAETFVMNLYRAIDREKVQFDFVIYEDGLRDYEAEISQLGGKIFLSPHFDIKNVKGYQLWWRDFFSKHQEYSVVHGHVRSTALIYLSEAKRKGIYTIAHSHSVSSGMGLTAILKKALQYPVRYIADYFMGCSTAANEWLFGKKIARGNKCEVIKNGININAYRFDEEKRRRLRNQLNIPEGAILIRNVGRLVPVKNQSFLIDVFESVLCKESNSFMVIVGDGPLKSKLQLKAETLGVDEQVRFLGNRRDVPDLLQAMDVFVFPSLYEGLGIALIEAQVNGLPCVVSDGVPREADLGCNLIEFLELSAGKECWSVEILRAGVKKRKSKEGEASACLNGYSIKNEATKIERFYMAHNR